MNDMTISACRLCGAQSVQVFESTILGKYDVGYSECAGCGSLQTVPPFWLDEAYGPDSMMQDVGIVQRTILNSLVVPVLLKLLGIDQETPCLDWGGGNGLFVRMMRDRGLSFFLYDKFVANDYARGFSVDRADDRPFPVITAFELLEHLPNPAEDLAQLFSGMPDLVIATTQVYNNEGPDWFYLAPDSGQHVFFYSLRGLDLIARRFGMRLFTNGMLHIFYRETPLSLHFDAPRLRAVHAALDRQADLLGSGLKDFQVHLQVPYAHVARDNDVILEKIRAVRPDRPVTPAGRLYLQLKNTAPRPRIMIDSIAFQHPQTDRAQVWRHLLEEWSQTDFARHLLVLDRGGWTPRFPGLATRLIAPCEGANAPAQRYFLERYAIEEAASLFISSGDTTPLTVPAVHMVYDRVAEASNLDPKAALERRTALDHARHYICLSPSIAATLARLYPDSVGRTTVAPPGVAASFHPLSEEDRQTVRAQIGAPQGFFLLVDGFGLHKNAEVLVQALARMPEAERLPIVYAPRASTAPEELPVMPEGTKMILIQGEEDARVRLYNAGTVLVLPSPDEEMPLALLEAMACGCPVVTCDLPGLREQGGDGASYFTPRDPDSLISVLRATRNPDSRTTPGAAARTRATRFTWSRMADIVRGVLEREASAANGP